jgi:hypothetical protein
VIIRDLGGGLVLRHGAREDAAKLVPFNAKVHGDPGPPDAGIAGWTRDLLERPHPTFSPEDFTIVEETGRGEIVSSLNLISQTWSYGGVPFGVGRIELVGTDPDYRRRGLVRDQFDVVHEWSTARGELVQAITGIRWYYRQFGYEYALPLDGGKRIMRSVLLEGADSTQDQYRIRPAHEADLPFIAHADEHGRRRSVVSCVRDLPMWRYELSGRSEDNGDRAELRMIESAAGDPVGFLVHDPRLRGPNVIVRYIELAEGSSWLGVIGNVLRYLNGVGLEYEQHDGAPRFDGVGFALNLDHPVYRVLPSRMPAPVRTYAWYIRVPDLPAFVGRIAPVLESRLASSLACGYTGQLRLNFYRSGLRLEFDNGRLRNVDGWPDRVERDASAHFPDLTFLQLLFCYRSLDDLLAAFPDCSVPGEEARVVLSALFPQQPSLVWGVV